MVTPGARFGQLQPVKAATLGGLDGTASPYTLFTVPAGHTYRLRYTSVSLMVATSAAFAAAGQGTFVSIKDSNGNSYAEAEGFLAAANQAGSNGCVLPCDNAVLPAGTVVQIVISQPSGVVAGFFVRAGGGAVWRLA
jgi:hypothetical protein